MTAAQTQPNHIQRASGARTTGELARRLGARLLGPDDLAITRLDTIDRAVEGCLTFIRDEAYAELWASSKASAALVTDGIEVPGHDPGSRALLMVKDADHALIVLLELMAPRDESPIPGVDPTAHVGEDVEIPASVSIGPGAVIEQGAVVGEHVSIGANTVIESGARIGAGSRLHANVVVQRGCVIGDGCILHPGVVIGADGFGYRPAEDGCGVVKIPHIGNVELGRGVEVGANSTIDRAKFGSTVIGDGTKIDNLCQIAHNCVIGKACIICAGAGVAGSVTIGDGAVLAGHVGIGDHIRIGARARIAGSSHVMNDVGDGETWFGTPATPIKEQARAVNAMRRLGKGLPLQPRAGKRRTDRTEQAPRGTDEAGEP